MPPLMLPSTRVMLRAADPHIAQSVDPTVYSGLQVLYDTSQVQGLVNSDPIDALLDLSGNSRSATRTGAQRPLFKTGINNGHPVARFDGIDDRLVTPAWTPGTDKLDIYLVANGTAGALGAWVVAGDPWYADNGWIVAHDTTNVLIGGFQGNVTIPTWTTVSTVTSAFKLIRVSMDIGAAAANEVIGYINGVSNGAIGTSGANTNSFSNKAMGLGGTNGGGYILGYDFSELAIYNRILAVSEAANLTEYFRAKYALF